VLIAVLTVLGFATSGPAQAVTIESNVLFSRAGGEELMMDIARPAGDGPFPAVICIHGGGFRAGNRSGYRALIPRLAERGYVAATVSYRLAPLHPFPAAVVDVKEAVRFLRKNARKYRIDPARIGAMGASAGGTLALMLGVTGEAAQFDPPETKVSCRVAAVVSYYGATDFTKSYGKSVDAGEVLPLYLGGNLQFARRNHILSSPLYWVTPAAAPTLFLHGTKDPYVEVAQSDWMLEKLKEAQVPAEILRIEGAGHGFKEAEASKADEAMFAFFDRVLKGRDDR
jgi:acetyl esterase/lipase